MIRNQTKIKLPRLISDGMVIQRNAQVNIWCWAPAGEVIAVHFMGKSVDAQVKATFFLGNVVDKDTVYINGNIIV
ncbi:hypothetical protein [Paenibacillus agricola]|uniref:Uncharacterized protein n=1 Tax=Paenibacillus agricola TaxID=2716264 RepID=A0ABX0JBG6_9BACL|nr:hypothetical protein [Paenibacillus agricola]NHN32611.1 hypothetical protein [Paenibacillus agricola]